MPHPDDALLAWALAVMLACRRRPCPWTGPAPRLQRTLARPTPHLHPVHSRQLPTYTSIDTETDINGRRVCIGRTGRAGCHRTASHPTLTSRNGSEQHVAQNQEDAAASRHNVYADRSVARDQGATELGTPHTVPHRLETREGEASVSLSSTSTTALVFQFSKVFGLAPQAISGAIFAVSRNRRRFACPSTANPAKIN